MPTTLGRRSMTPLERFRDDAGMLCIVVLASLVVALGWWRIFEPRPAPNWMSAAIETPAF